jgi:4-amino-4-deoxychorismate lyase
MIMRGVSVLAVLGRGLLPAGTPFIRADDLGLTRGDGIFETIHVRRGEPWLLAKHLDRLYVSAARMELPAPSRAELTGLADLACGQWSADEEGALKIVVTRGPEGLGEITCYATLTPVAESSIAARSAGIEVKTLSFGYPVKARQGAPWLLGGVKSLSYGVNMASQRWAVAHGAQDAIWISDDGYVLEGTTSSFVWLEEDRLCTVPSQETGILAGCTAQFALDHAGELGLTATEKLLTVDELPRVDSAWLLSSVRGLAPIRTVDGITVPSRDIGLRPLLGF